MYTTFSDSDPLSAELIVMSSLSICFSLTQEAEANADQVWVRHVNEYETQAERKREIVIGWYVQTAFSFVLGLTREGPHAVEWDEKRIGEQGAQVVESVGRQRSFDSVAESVRVLFLWRRLPRSCVVISHFFKY